MSHAEIMAQLHAELEIANRERGSTEPSELQNASVEERMRYALEAGLCDPSSFHGSCYDAQE